MPTDQKNSKKVMFEALFGGNGLMTISEFNQAFETLINRILRFEKKLLDSNTTASDELRQTFVVLKKRLEDTSSADLSSFKQQVQQALTKTFNQFTARTTALDKQLTLRSNMLKDGHTPTQEELLALIQPVVLQAQPTNKQLTTLITPLIPPPLNGSPDTGEEVIVKINHDKSDRLIRKDKVEGLAGLETLARTAHANSQYRFGGDSVAAGTNVTITTIAGIKYISATGTTLEEETPSGAVNGVNTQFVFTERPNFIISDGVWYRNRTVDTGFIFGNPSLIKDIVTDTIAGELTGLGTNDYPEIGFTTPAQMEATMVSEISTWINSAHSGSLKHITFGPSVYDQLSETDQADTLFRELTDINATVTDLEGVTIWQFGATDNNPKSRLFDWNGVNWVARSVTTTINTLFAAATYSVKAIHIGSQSQDVHTNSQAEINAIVTALVTAIPNLTHISIAPQMDYGAGSTDDQFYRWATAIHAAGRKMWVRSPGFNDWDGLNGIAQYTSPHNYVVNTEFENDANYWGTGGGMTKARSTAQAYLGNASLLLTGTTMGDFGYVTFSDGGTPTVATSYTFSCYLKGSGTVNLAVYDGVADNYSTDIVLSGTWTLHTLSIPCAAVGMLAGIRINTSNAVSCYVDTVSWTEDGAAPIDTFSDHCINQYVTWVQDNHSIFQTGDRFLPMPDETENNSNWVSIYGGLGTVPGAAAFNTFVTDALTAVNAAFAAYKGWSWSGTTATMAVPPTDDIYGLTVT